MESKKKHKLKRKHGDAEELNTDEDLNSVNVNTFNATNMHTKLDDDHLQQDHHKKKKKKKKHSEAFDDELNAIKSEVKDAANVEYKDINAISDELVPSKKKKKHKKKKHKHTENTTERDNQGKNDIGQLSLESEGDYSDISGAIKKSKKKKKKHSKEITDEKKNTDDSEVTTEATTLQNSKLTYQSEEHDSDDISTSQMRKKKSKKHKRELTETSELKLSQDYVLKGECTEPPNAKKVKIEQSEVSGVVDGMIVNASKLNGQEDKSGQWSSADLGDTERQNKFMRLLGGFKKGNNTSQIQKKFGLQRTGNLLNRPGGNFAMNRQQQDVYTKKLESDYERAMGMNLNRGVGIGFQKPPDEGKKFYIDTKSSKSVKFDD